MVTVSRMASQISEDRYSITLSKRTYTVSSHRILLAILVMSIALRLVSAIYQGNTVTDLPGIYDQISYDGLARRVVEGYGFSFAEGHWPATRAGEPTAHWSYIYTIYLVAVYRLFGTYPVIARVIQALVAGAFQTLFIWRIGTRLFGGAVGLIAAALNAIYIYFFYYAGALITETFYVTGILWICDVAFRLASATQNMQQRTTSPWQWVELGIAIGITVLLRQVFLIFLPILYLWLWWNIRDQGVTPWEQRFHRSAIKGLSLATLVLFLLIIPWTIRNYRAFGTFVLLNTNAGFAFFWGNHPVYGTHFIPLLPSSGPNSYYELIPKELLSLNEAKLDKALLGKGIQFVVDDPSRFFWLSLSRIPVFFEFWPSPASGLISNISRVASFGICLPFMVYGLWLSMTREWKSRTTSERSAILLLLLFVCFYSAIHLLSWALIRYRLPIDAVLLVFAALGIENLIRGNSSLARVRVGDV
jgi:hypothetical protein